jgi:hypothetical protein
MEIKGGKRFNVGLISSTAIEERMMAKRQAAAKPAAAEPGLLPWINETIARSLAGVDQRDKELAALPAWAGAGWEERLEGMRERLQGLAVCAERGGATVAEVDGLLRDAEQQLRTYLAAVESVRARLAGWEGRAVG